MEDMNEAFAASSEEALLDAAGLDVDFELDAPSPMIAENIDFA